MRSWASIFYYALNLYFSWISSLYIVSRREGFSVGDFSNMLSISWLKHLPLFYWIALLRSSNVSLLRFSIDFSSFSLSGSVASPDTNANYSLSVGGSFPIFSNICSSCSLLKAAKSCGAGGFIILCRGQIVFDSILPLSCSVLTMS